MNYFNLFSTGKPKRSKVQTGKNTGIAKVLLGDGPDHVGMGIVIDPWHMITCAHVINDALMRDEAEQTKPDEPVKVAFPMLGHPTEFSATVVAWRPPGLKQQDDIAILKFDNEVPKEVSVAMLADVSGMSPDGDELSVFGLAAGQLFGTHVDAKFKGPTSAAWVQLDASDPAVPYIEGGFSGAAVWDRPHSAVLGMVVAKRVSTQQVAYMIPTADLSEFWPDLQVEDRPLSPTFARTWTIFSAVYFFLLLAHWAVDRGIRTFSVVTVSGDHKELAAFWGMHIYALLAPFVLMMLIAFAKSFRLHNWIKRVPSFGGVRMRPISSSTGITAAASIAAFVILPLIAQVHFIRQFNDQGFVYIYPDSFGYKSSDPEFKTERCYTRSIHLCTKSEAGRYSLANPKPGVTAGYWDNAYHYGDLDQGDGGTVTFFPILQPVIIYLLTVLSVVLSASALFHVFRRTPEQSLRKDIAMKQGVQSPPMIDPPPVTDPPQMIMT
jgi:hypothetical protein